MGCFAFALSFAGDVFVFAFGDGGGAAAVGCGERGQHVAFVWQWRGGGVPVGNFGDCEMVGAEPLDAQGAALLRCAPAAFVGLYFGIIYSLLLRSDCDQPSEVFALILHPH